MFYKSFLTTVIQTLFVVFFMTSCAEENHYYGETHGCQHGGYPVYDRDGVVSCVCPMYRTGLHCEQEALSCNDNPCQHGTCTNTVPVAGYVCSCEPGYTGVHCNININDCKEESCHGHGSCVDEVNGFSCLCNEGFSGTHCENARLPAFTFEGLVVFPQQSPVKIPDNILAVTLSNDAVFSTNRPPFQTSAVLRETRDVYLNNRAFTLTSYDGYGLDYAGTITGNGTVYVASVQMMGNRDGMHPYSPRPLVLSGSQSNTYAGPTVFMRGVIALNKSEGATAIPGRLTLQHQGANDRIKWMRSHQIADHADVVFESPEGTLDLNGYQETFRHLTMAEGATFKMDGEGSASGVLNIESLIYAGKKYKAGTYTRINHQGLRIQGDGEIQIRTTAP